MSEGMMRLVVHSASDSEPLVRTREFLPAMPGWKEEGGMKYGNM
jgi:hypothetical protein